MIRLTLADSGDLLVHDGLHQRELTDDEASLIREALPAGRVLPLWFDMGVLAVGLLALAIMWHGGGA